MVFLLQLDEPLAGGEAGVRYEVTAADGHVLEGGFRFTVPAAACDRAGDRGDRAGDGARDRCSGRHHLARR